MLPTLWLARGLLAVWGLALVRHDWRTHLISNRATLSVWVAAVLWRAASGQAWIILVVAAGAAWVMLDSLYLRYALGVLLAALVLGLPLWGEPFRFLALTWLALLVLWDTGIIGGGDLKLGLAVTVVFPAPQLIVLGAVWGLGQGAVLLVRQSGWRGALRRLALAVAQFSGAVVRFLLGPLFAPLVARLTSAAPRLAGWLAHLPHADDLRRDPLRAPGSATFVVAALGYAVLLWNGRADPSVGLVLAAVASGLVALATIWLGPRLRFLTLKRHTPEVR